MKNNFNYFVWIFVLALGISSCESDGDKSPEPPKPPELTMPSITSPQNGSVCQGVLDSNGTYTVSIVSSAVYGAADYSFSLWDSRGKLVAEKKSSTNRVSFSNIAKGSAYTVGVKVTNTLYKKESTKVSFSTPGEKVINYIPVVKKVVYSPKESSLLLKFYDADDSDILLYYSVLVANTPDFKKVKKLKDNVETKKDIDVVIPNINIQKGSYLKILVKDKQENTSSQVLFYE